MTVFSLRREAEARAHEATAASDRGDHAESSRLWSEAADLRQAHINRVDEIVRCAHVTILVAGLCACVAVALLVGLPR